MALYSYTRSIHQTSENQEEIKSRRLLIRTLATVFSFFIFLITSLLLRNINRTISPVSTQAKSIKTVEQIDSAAVLGETIEQANTLMTSPSPSPLPTLASLPLVLSPAKSAKPFTAKKLYTVAIIGDSMVDTMGEVLEYLDTELKKKYPETKFLLYNYGTGAQNIEAGLNRFSSKFKYQARDYQSIPELRPDILIVASFAYNPFTPHDRDKHWLTLTKLVQTAKQYTPRVYMMAEIAPLRKDFGKGPNGVNWSEDANYEHSLRIIQQLENTLGLAKTLNIPLIDAFTPSFHSEDREGKREYVNPSDGIHPSVEGHKFMAEKIAETITAP